jgi:hypothetical protein
MGHVYTGAKRVLVWLGENMTRVTMLTLTYIKMIATHDPTNFNCRSQLEIKFEEIRKGDG